MKSKATDELLEFSSEESLSEDDEDGWKETEELEKEFYKTLSSIKNKDPKIYDKDVEFFKDIAIPQNKVTKKGNTNPLTLRDYERKIITEKGGELSDEEPVVNNHNKKILPTYVEEQESLKNSFKALVNSGSEDENDKEWGGLFKKRQKTEDEKKTEEEEYKVWLKGKKKNAPDEEVEREMKPLRDYWTNPDLNKDDQFLRDYVLNKRFIDHDEEDENKVNMENLLEDSDEGEQEVTFESTHNHRFEEQDQEFVKRYPRVMEHSLRLKNKHRKKKREEVKERKLKEKAKKRAEIKNKQKLKRKEIEEKIKELKELTGNDQLAFENVLEQDFNLDEYDQAMQHLFNEEFYSQVDPSFNPTGSGAFEGDWNEEDYEEQPVDMTEIDDSLHCEDQNFNMDCDYDPRQVKPKEKTSRRRKRKDRRTTVSEAVRREKPNFDPATHETFQQYVDQYYAIDCEDFIGDLACRFKYRRTIPNSYGLTIEEILAADENELERWCSIKRIQQLRPEFKEKGDVKVFSKKAADESLKRKILPSLYKMADSQDSASTEKKKNNISENNNVDTSTKNGENKSKTEAEPNETLIKTKKKTKKRKPAPSVEVSNEENVANKSKNETEPDETLIKTKKKKKKRKPTPSVEATNEENVAHGQKRKLEMPAIKSKRKKTDQNDQCKKWPGKTNKKSNKFAQQNNRQTETSTLSGLSDARLLAYGIKPKKFRNKLKYNKNTS